MRVSAAKFLPQTQVWGRPGGGRKPGFTWLPRDKLVETCLEVTTLLVEASLRRARSAEERTRRSSVGRMRKPSHRTPARVGRAFRGCSRARCP